MTDVIRQALDIVSKALECDADQRPALIERACADKTAVRAEVDRLLALTEEDAANGFLDRAPELTVKSVVTDPLLGRSVGPYNIIKRLGEGGMGVVYLAEQVKPIRRQVALKVIKPGMDSARVISRFQAEQQTLACMDHPNVAMVLDAGFSEQGQSYFVMEYVDGCKITEYCDSHRLSTEDRLRLFMRVSDAVQHAHQKGIIHRDIKPSNVLVTLKDGVATPKVIDFGVAKATERGFTRASLFTEQGQLIGTPEYMSPEQSDPTVEDIDTRSDIYSLGVLLYELLAGALPFEPRAMRGAAIDELRRIIREEDPPKPSDRLSTSGGAASQVGSNRGTDCRSLHKQVRGDLDWIVMKCLEKDRSRRYPTATALSHDIARHLNREPVEAGPPTTRYRFGKFVRRHRAGVLAVGAMSFILIAATVVSIQFAVGESTQKAEAQRQTEIAILATAEAERQAALAREEATQKQQLLAESYAHTATVAAHRGDWQAVLVACDDAVDAGLGDQFRLQLAKADALLALHDIEGASQILADLARLDDFAEHEGSVLLRQADIALHHSSDRAGTMELLRRALEADLPSADRAYGQGLISTAAVDAVMHFEKALRIDPFYYRARQMLSVAMLFLGRFDEADKLLYASLAASPDDPDLNVFLALSQVLQGKLSDALQTAETLREQLGDTKTDALQLLITLTGEAAPVDRYLDGTMGAQPAPALLRRLMPFLAAFQLGGLETATGPGASLFAGGLFVPPWVENGFMRLFPSVLAHTLGNGGRAVEIIEAAAAVHPIADLHAFRGRMLLDAGRVAEAEAAFRMATELPTLVGLSRTACIESASLAWRLADVHGEHSDPAMRDRAVEALLKLEALGDVGPIYAARAIDIAVGAREFDLARRIALDWRRRFPKDFEALRKQLLVEFESGAYFAVLAIAETLLKEVADDSAATDFLERAREGIRKSAAE